MPLKTQISAIVAGMLVIDPVAPATENTAPGFIFGTANEVNVKADSEIVFPVVCMYPMQPIELQLSVNGSVDDWFNIYMEFLYITKFEKDSEQDEPLVMQALALANLFLTRVRDYKETQQSATYFELSKNDRHRAFPVYNRLDVNTTGIGLTIRLKKRVDEYYLNC